MGCRRKSAFIIGLFDIGQTVNSENYIRMLPEYPLKEVQLHDSVDDAWIVLFNYVFNITSLFDKHPGGMEVLLENIGRDGSLVFLGGGHENVPMSCLKEYLIGVLPENEHIPLPYSGWHERVMELKQLITEY